MKNESALREMAGLLLLSVLLSGCQTNTFTHKQFQERIARVQNIGLLPAQVHTALLNKISGNEPLVPLAEEQQIRSELTASIIEQFRQRNFTVKDESLEGTNRTWDANIYFGSPPDTPRIGAKTLATNLNVDALVFLEVSAFKSTQRRQNWAGLNNSITLLGTIAAGAGGGGGTGGVWIPVQQAEVQIMLIGGKTGEVLWMTAEDFGDFGKVKPSKAVEDLFSRYPKTQPVN